MPDALAHLDQILDYVYTRANGTSSQRIEILECAESLGLNMDEAFTIVWATRDAGLSQDGSGFGAPAFRLTAAGLAYVREMRQRRDDPAQRAAACRTALLRWFYRQHLATVHFPITGEFGQSDDAQHEGTRFTDVEIQHAAEYLADKNLIKGVSVAEMRGPVRAEITTEGIDCVTDWSGDVARYLHDKRGYGPTTNYHGPVFNAKADGNQFAWQNRDVTQIAGGQTVTAGYEPLAAAVADLIRSLPTLGLSPQDQQDVQDVAEEIAGEIVQDQPNPGRLRRAGAAIRGLLWPIATGAVAGVSDEVREEAGKLVEHITSAVT